MSKLLIIEDNRTNLKLLSDVLTINGFEVEEATDANSGIELALAGDIDLILMDIQLPGIDGLEATRILRSHPQTKDILILAVTAHAMEGDRQRALDAGCNAYATKPIAYKELLSTVNDLLQTSKNGKTR